MLQEHDVDLAGGVDPSRFYVCQIPDRRQVKKWLKNLHELAPTAPERHWCAMCAVRSLLLAEQLPAPPLPELFAAACQKGVYMPDQEKGWKGAFHQQLSEFVSSLTGTEASAERGLEIAAIQEKIESGFYCLLSVHPSIRQQNPQKLPERKRGHMILVYGLTVIDGVTHFLYNNSAGFAHNHTQAGAVVSVQRLAEVACGDGVFVRSRHFSPQH